ncbi:hypothetical protein CWATWH0402_1827 [Crocosphaera watsonii WH 0402]|uniref:Uncharacterized protein n=1 Tax=Crocosphaera watsonii WH 0402 TaxID=1284629 RepID=T2JID6_CROWT|nr:hypothetical protein CWATWH0402_1827 [Crocosphaera watsonii WH 0402]
MLVEGAIALAQKLKISDIDLLISIEQTGVHKLLERFGFKKAAIQYTQHYEIKDKNLPPLKPQVSQSSKFIVINIKSVYRSIMKTLGWAN